MCDFQCFFWQGFPQYQARWHCEQHILAPSDWQWKQRWVSTDAAAPLPLPLPFFPVLPVVPLVVLNVLVLVLELLLALVAVAAEVSVAGPSTSDAASSASDAARASSAVFGGMAGLQARERLNAHTPLNPFRSQKNRGLFFLVIRYEI